MGLIYWGFVKEIKKYGKIYRIVFKDKPKVDNINYSISIYIQNEGLCFFVGAYPQFVEVEKNKEKFKVLDVTIDNLDHIAFTFGGGGWHIYCFFVNITEGYQGN